MIIVNMQYFGNKGSSSGKSGGAAGGEKEPMKETMNEAVAMSNAQDYIAHHLSYNETSAVVDSVELVSDINEKGMAEVRVEYHANLRIETGWDDELNRPEYEYDTEYKSRELYIKVR